MRTLVTGGAGYIGSHVVRLLADSGHHVVIADDLSNGDATRNPDVPLVSLDLTSPAATDSLAAAMRSHAIDSVIHFAARKRVDESVARPSWYYSQNISGLVTVIDAMRASDVGKLIFSSSAAVYGASEGLAITEDEPTKPINPYGTTKLVGEWLIADAARAFGLRAVNLRYFNVAGAGWSDLGDRAVLNLIPMVFERIEQGLDPLIFGDDYDTPDGTCIRDFIHVHDLARAHLAAVDYLADATGNVSTFNVGTGVGASVRQVIETIGQVAGVELTPEVRPRRAGDPAIVVAAGQRLREAAGWRAEFNLHDIVESAWAANRYSVA